MEYVIFDFNGTIVNDVDLSIACMNNSIKKYLNRKPLTIEEYRNIFCFPVKDYYEKVGFDFNKFNWQEVGQHWMDYYVAHQDEQKLHEGVLELLKSNKEKGIKNILLSASKIDLLIKQVKNLGIYDYFDEILGLDDIYATSKIPIALNWIKDKDPNECLFIGDSAHDKQVADQMKVRCILIAKGHESKQRLLKIHDEVLDSMKEVKICA